jgi:hypothetical protein
MAAELTPQEIAAGGTPVFPCHPDNKRPLTRNGFYDASEDPDVVGAWWSRSPHALVGVPTGVPIDAVVLDVDVKRTNEYGFDTLDQLGLAILPNTPMVHTRSGGLHLYFRRPVDRVISNTNGAWERGIGPGLDWRGDGGYVIVPSRGSGYWWDPHCNFDTTELADVPVQVLPREPEKDPPPKPVRPETGLSRYAEAALDAACRRIISAPAGEQEGTLNGEAFAIGTLAGSNGIPAGLALRALVWAARQVRSFDARRPWRATESYRKVERAFAAGMRRHRDGSPAHG